MSKTSKELLNHVEKPSLLDGLLLSSNHPTPQTQKSKLQNPVKSEEILTITSLPKSQVLGKVRDFLGAMAKANKDLEVKAQENSCPNYDIEVLNGDEKEYIEMDLLLGIADLHSDEAVAAAEASLSVFQQTVVSASNSSSDHEDCYSDSNDDGDEKYNSGDETTVNKPKKKPTDHSTGIDESARNKRPKVVMLD